jgi:hypothetical protein
MTIEKLATRLSDIGRLAPVFPGAGAFLWKKFRAFEKKWSTAGDF